MIVWFTARAKGLVILGFLSFLNKALGKTSGIWEKPHNSKTSEKVFVLYKAIPVRNRNTVHFTHTCRNKAGANWEGKVKPLLSGY